MKKLAAILFIPALILACNNSMYIEKTSSFKTEDRTLLHYSLPRTVLHINVPVVITKKTKSAYLENLDAGTLKTLISKYTTFNVGRLITNNDTSYSIKKDGIVITPVAVPDNEKRFAVRYSACPFKKMESSFQVTKDGLITTGNVAQSDIVVETSIKLTEYALELVTAAAVFSPEMGESGSDKKQGSTGTRAPASVIEESDDENKSIKLEVLRLAKRLAELQNAKLNLYQQDGFKTLDILKYQEKQINKEMADIVTRLFGKTTKTVQWLSFTYEPDKQNPPSSKELKLLQVYEKAIKYGSGKLIPNSANNALGDMKKALTLEIDQPANEYDSALIKAKGGTDFDKKRGFYYNIPAKLDVRLKYGDTYLMFKNSADDKSGVASRSVYFAQLGVVGFLPRKMSKIDFAFYEDLGSLKSVTFTKDIYLTSDRMDGVLGAVDSARAVYWSYRENREESEAVEETATGAAIKVE